MWMATLVASRVGLSKFGLSEFVTLITYINRKIILDGVTVV